MIVNNLLVNENSQFCFMIHDSTLGFMLFDNLQVSFSQFSQKRNTKYLVAKIEMILCACT